VAAPSVGDVDGSGKLDVATVTRDGWLWVWRTSAPASTSMLEWPSVRHDIHKTGRYGQLLSEPEGSVGRR
jgi:hypothetical protein